MNSFRSFLFSLQRWLEKPVHHPAKTAFILCAAAFALLVLACTPAFRRDDTAAMMCIANGTFTGVPSPHLVFSNILFGKLLVQLYAIAPDFPFYPVAMYLVLFLSFAVVTWHLIKAWPARYSILTASAFIAVFGLTQFLIKLEFTQVALAAMTAALLSLSNSSHLHTILRTFLVLVFSFLAFIIRSDVFYLFLPLALIITIVNRRSILVSILTIALVFSIFWLLLDYNDKAYRDDPAWKSYHSFNLARGKVIDYQITIPPEELLALGLTDIDIKAINAWVIHDTNIITTPVFQKLTKFVPGRFFINSATMAWLSKTVSGNISQEIFKPSNMAAFLVIIASILLAYRSFRSRLALLLVVFASTLIVPATFTFLPLCCFFLGKRFRSTYSGLIHLGITSLILYLAISGRIPNFLAAGLSSISVLFFLSDSARCIFSQTNQKTRNIGAGILLFVTAFSVMLACLKLSPENAIRQKKLQQLVSTLSTAFPPDSAFILYPPAFIEDFGVFKTSMTDKTIRPRLIAQGWLSHSPVQQQQLRINNFTNIRELLFSPRSYVITTWKKRFMVLDNFCRQHYGHGVITTTVRSNIYRLETASRTGDSK